MTNVDDTDFDFDAPEATEAPTKETEATATDTDNEVTEEAPKRRGRKPGKRPKHPLPADWETPSDLAIRVNFEGTLGQDDEGENIEIEGTTLYQYAKSRSADPEVTGDPENVGDFPSRKHSDGRLICEIAPAMDWLANKAEEMADRDRLRAERAAQRGQAQMRSFIKAVYAQSQAAA